ncbi:DUF4340 domain-containing protein [Tundrisphaera sp. TA3]|uniref:DUF4340 domain-containing protein n=1 Tax=Tundrisphaera sp. TA3 TaxID=3435775 RepID=UPI003EBA9300
MKNRGNLLLMGVFLAGMLGLWWADRARIPTRVDRARAEGRVLPALLDTRPEELRRIEIVGGPAPIVLERRGANNDRWQMISPLDVAADPSKAEALAFNLKSLARRPETEARQAGSPDSFGLAPPERTVRLWGTAADKPLATLDIGRISLDRRFVRPGGSGTVEAVDARMLGLVDIPPAQWRDREIFRVPSFEVDAVTIQASDRPEALKLRRDRDAWRVVAPIRALADGSRIDGLAADLAALRVIDDGRFVADNARDLAKYGLDKPALTITVEAGRDSLRRTPQILHVGKPIPGAPGQVYARRDDQDDVIALDDRTLKGIVANPSAFRDNHVADIDPNRVDAIEIEANGHTFALGRHGKSWTLTEPQTARADIPAVAAFLKSLDELQTAAFLPKSSVPDPGLDAPSVVLRVWQAPLPGASTDSGSSGSSSPPQLTLKLGRRDAARKTVYAMTEDDPNSVLALPDSAVDFIPRNSLGFRNRLVLAIAPDQIDRVAFESEGKTTVINAPIFRMDGPGKSLGSWWMGQPITAPADMESVERLLKLFSGLQADSLVADQADDPKKYGFDRPLLKVTASRPAASAGGKNPPPGVGPLRVVPDELTLLIGKAVPDRLGVHYAMIVGEPLVFTVGGNVLVVLDSEWRDHRIMAFSADEARRVNVAWPDRRIDFVGNGEPKADARVWGFAGAVDAPDFDPTQAKALVAALSDLKTTRYVQYEGPMPAAMRLNPPLAEIRVDVAEGDDPPPLRLGAPTSDGKRLATVAPGDSGAVFLVPEALFGPWARSPRHQDDLPEDVFAP